MNILVTGAKGFIGKNFIETLKTIRDGKNKIFEISNDITILEYDIDSDKSLLDDYCRRANFISHLAGVNRPKEQSEFMEGNYNFTSELLRKLKKYGNTCPIMVSSSVQAGLNNPYGKSKKAEEDIIFSYEKESGAKVLVYRFPNVFGKWCKPNYNSVIATFCYNISHDLPIVINDRSKNMILIYIDDLVNELINALQGKESREGDYCRVPEEYQVSLGEIAELIYGFKQSREDRSIPNMSNLFIKKLYATYLSYLPTDKFTYPLKMNIDERGSFTEIIRTPDRGQFSINISKPGIIKGNHWHHTKSEKFIVVSGKGVVRFKKINSDNIYEYHVSGEKLEVIDVPAGYTHNIENLGNTDMVTFMWASEGFNPDKPDTYWCEV